MSVYHIVSGLWALRFGPWCFSSIQGVVGMFYVGVYSKVVEVLLFGQSKLLYAGCCASAPCSGWKIFGNCEFMEFGSSGMITVYESI